MLRDTLDKAKDKFCPLILEIVNTAIIYRHSKINPITKEEIESLNKLVLEIGFKIPELWDIKFLSGLPSSKKESKKPEPSNQSIISELKKEYIEVLPKIDPQKRGYNFQDFLIRFFAAYGLKPKSAFRLVGEEIDGSFEIGEDTYLLEAKWQKTESGQAELATFSSKVGGKSTWSRGLFISYTGFSKEGLQAFARGKPTNIIAMNGQDLYFILEGKLTLNEAIRMKARRAAETNEIFVSVYDLADK